MFAYRERSYLEEYRKNANKEFFAIFLVSRLELFDGDDSGKT